MYKGTYLLANKNLPIPPEEVVAQDLLILEIEDDQIFRVVIELICS